MANTGASIAATSSPDAATPATRGAFQQMPSITVVTASAAVAATSRLASQVRHRRCSASSPQATVTSNATQPHFTAGPGNQRATSAEARRIVHGTSRRPRSLTIRAGPRAIVASPKPSRSPRANAASTSSTARTPEVPCRERQVHRVPARRPQLCLEGVQPLEIEQVAAGPAREAQRRPHAAGQWGQAQRHHLPTARKRLAHGVVEKKLGGSIRRLWRPQQILQQPSLPIVDRRHRKNADRQAGALGDEQSAIGQQRQRLDAREEAERRELAHPQPARDHAYHRIARRRADLCAGTAIDRTDVDTFRARATQLLPQARRIAKGAVPGSWLPDRLLAHQKRSHRDPTDEAILRREEAGPPIRRPRGVDECRRYPREASLRRQRRSGGDPGPTGVDERDARFPVRKEVPVAGLEHLERRRAGSEAPDQLQHVRALVWRVAIGRGAQISRLAAGMHGGSIGAVARPVSQRRVNPRRPPAQPWPGAPSRIRSGPASRIAHLDRRAGESLCLRDLRSP